MRDYLDSRPAVAEVEAVARAIVLAGEAGCSLHVVHVSTAAAVALITDARSRGLDVTCETCPHYLVLTDDDAERIGALAKCSPPLRPEAEVEALWLELLAGNVQIVASDHSPAAPELKQGDDAFSIWGGISGCQTGRATVLTECDRRGLTLPAVASLTATAAAARFSLPAKGALEPGRDADLALIDLDFEAPLAAADLLYRHPHSPFTGRALRGRVRRTILRGTTVVEDGRVTGATPAGRLVKPFERQATLAVCLQPPGARGC
jgi:allantoinase